MMRWYKAQTTVTFTDERVIGGDSREEAEYNLRTLLESEYGNSLLSTDIKIPDKPHENAFCACRSTCPSHPDALGR